MIKITIVTNTRNVDIHCVHVNMEIAWAFYIIQLPNSKVIYTGCFKSWKKK